MAEFRRQHWLPAGYLQFFSISGTPLGRHTKVFCANATSCWKTGINNVCVGTYHYSKADAARVETSFHAMEKAYPRIVKSILGGHPLRKADYYGLILTALDFNNRNPSYENRTGKDNYSAYEIISRSAIEMVFADADGAGSDLLAMAGHFERYWGVQPVVARNEKLITSDHPSVLFSLSDDTDLAFMFLPVHPRCGVMFFDARKVQPARSIMTDDDVGLLNAFQAAKCIRHLYADHDLSMEIGPGKPITKWFSRARPNGFIEHAKWKPELFRYPGNIPRNLSFVLLV